MDSTSNCGINIKSSHMNLHVADYSSGNLSVKPKSTLKVCFLGVEKTINHSSVESVRRWNQHMEENIDPFNLQPQPAC
jgi:hypothetical protein